MAKYLEGLNPHENTQKAEKGGHQNPNKAEKYCLG